MINLDRLTKDLERERELTLKYLEEEEKKEKAKELKEEIKEQKRIRGKGGIWPFNRG